MSCLLNQGVLPPGYYAVPLWTVMAPSKSTWLPCASTRGVTKAAA